MSKRVLVEVPEDVWQREDAEMETLFWETAVRLRAPLGS